MSQSNTSSRTIFNSVAPQQSQRPACPPAGAFLLNNSYVSEYGLRLLEETVPQNQNQSQSQWSPDAITNFSFGIIMFVLALIGLLIQSHRCRSFMMKCFHIRDNQGPSTFDSRRAIDLLLTAASCKRRPCDYSLHIRAP